jgi:hypothetical protein
LKRKISRVEDGGKKLFLPFSPFFAIQNIQFPRVYSEEINRSKCTKWNFLIKIIFQLEEKEREDNQSCATQAQCLGKAIVVLRNKIRRAINFHSNIDEEREIEGKNCLEKIANLFMEIYWKKNGLNSLVFRSVFGSGDGRLCRQISGEHWKITSC